MGRSEVSSCLQTYADSTWLGISACLGQWLSRTFHFTMWFLWNKHVHGNPMCCIFLVEPSPSILRTHFWTSWRSDLWKWNDVLFQTQVDICPWQICGVAFLYLHFWWFTSKVWYAKYVLIFHVSSLYWVVCYMNIHHGNPNQQLLKVDGNSRVGFHEKP